MMEISVKKMNTGNTMTGLLESFVALNLSGPDTMITHTLTIKEAETLLRKLGSELLK